MPIKRMTFDPKKRGHWLWPKSLAATVNWLATTLLATRMSFITFKRRDTARYVLVINCLISSHPAPAGAADLSAAKWPLAQREQSLKGKKRHLGGGQIAAAADRISQHWSAGRLAAVGKVVVLVCSSQSGGSAASPWWPQPPMITFTGGGSPASQSVGRRARRHIGMLLVALLWYFSLLNHARPRALHSGQPSGQAEAATLLQQLRVSTTLALYQRHSLEEVSHAAPKNSKRIIFNIIPTSQTKI